MGFDQLPVNCKRHLPDTEHIKRMHQVYELLELPSRVTPDGHRVEMVDLPGGDDELAEMIGEIVNRQFE